MNKLVQIVCWGWMIFSLSTVLAEEALPAADNPVISLDFQDIEVRKALQMLAKFTKINLIIEGSIQGKLSLHLSQVLVEEALQAILQLHDLTQQRKGNTRIIRPKNTQDTVSSTSQSPLVETKQIIVQHREAKEIGALFLENQTHKTQGSELSVDTSSNSLWIRDTPDRIQNLEKLVSIFDQTVQQVLIEARIVSVNRNFDRSLGVRLGFKPLSTMRENKEDAKKVTEDTTYSENSFPALNLDLPNFRQTLNRAAPLLWTGFSRLLDLELAAMENEGHVQVISSPHLMATDRTAALIEAGSEIPYQEKGKYGTSIAFKKAVLSLQVTPRITPSGQILLNLEVNHDKPGTPSKEKTPDIDTQKLKTQVLIKSGETVVLGGIYETVRQQSIYRVPGLGSIPILGWFFSQRGYIESSRELLVFITPHLVSDTLLKQRQESLR